MYPIDTDQDGKVSLNIKAILKLDKANTLRTLEGVKISEIAEDFSKKNEFFSSNLIKVEFDAI